MTTFTTCVGAIFIMWCQSPEPSKTTATVCPPVVEWKTVDQKTAAAELKKLPPGHTLRTMGAVTVKQRNINRQCFEARKPKR